MAQPIEPALAELLRNPPGVEWLRLRRICDASILKAKQQPRRRRGPKVRPKLDAGDDEDIHLLTPATYGVLLILSRCRKPRAISFAHIAAKAGLSNRTVRRSVRSLQVLGLIECQSSKGKRMIFKTNAVIGAIIKKLDLSAGRLLFVIAHLIETEGKNPVCISDDSLCHRIRLRFSVMASARRRLIEKRLLQRTSVGASHVSAYSVPKRVLMAIDYADRVRSVDEGLKEREERGHSWAEKTTKNRVLQGSAQRVVTGVTREEAKVPLKPFPVETSSTSRNTSYSSILPKSKSRSEISTSTKSPVRGAASSETDLAKPTPKRRKVTRVADAPSIPSEDIHEVIHKVFDVLHIRARLDSALGLKIAGQLRYLAAKEGYTKDDMLTVIRHVRDNLCGATPWRSLRSPMFIFSRLRFPALLGEAAAVESGEVALPDGRTRSGAAHSEWLNGRIDVAVRETREKLLKDYDYEEEARYLAEADAKEEEDRRFAELERQAAAAEKANKKK